MDAVKQQHLVGGIDEGVNCLAHHRSAAGPDSGNRFARRNQQIADQGNEYGFCGRRHSFFRLPVPRLQNSLLVSARAP